MSASAQREAMHLLLQSIRQHYAQSENPALSSLLVPPLKCQIAARMLKNGMHTCPRSHRASYTLPELYVGVYLSGIPDDGFTVCDINCI